MCTLFFSFSSFVFAVPGTIWLDMTPHSRFKCSGFCLLWCLCLCLNLVSCFSQCLVASIGFERVFFSVFGGKKKEKIVFYWFKMLIIIIPFEVTSGRFCDIAFPSPGVFSVFFFICTRHFVMHYFLYLDSFQQSADDFF